MQIMIDSANDDGAYLRRVAKFLNEEADIREADATPPALKLVPMLETAPKVDLSAVGFGKQPAGLDGHGSNPAPLPVILPQVVPTAAPAGAGVPQLVPAQLEFDSAGLPWDARIHQATRGKKVDETWKLKKGLDPAVATTVIAELRAAHPLPNPASLSFVAPAAPIPQQAPPPPVTQVAPPPPSETPATVAQAVPSAQVTDFRKLMQKITTATNAGKLTNVQVDAALQSVDLPPRQLVSLVQNPDKVAGVDAYIDACLASA